MLKTRKPHTEMELTASPFLLLTIPITVVVATVLLLILLLRTRQRERLPPGPKGVPLLGCLPFADPNLHRYFSDLAKTYGPILSLRLGTKLHVAITSPDLAKEIFKTQDAVFANHAVPSLTLRITGAPNILFAPYGPYWRVVRKVAVHEVLCPTVINSFQALRQREVHRVLAKLQSRVGTAVNLGETAFSIVVNVLLGMIWEDVHNEKKGSVVGIKELLEVFDGITEATGFFNIADYVPILRPLDLQGLYRKMAVMSKRLDAVLDSIIRQRLTSSCSKTRGVRDFLQIMLDLVDKKDPEVALEIVHVKTMLMEILFAGSDTSTATMVWVMTELTRHPKAMAKVQQELDAVVGRDCVVEESHIPKLEYLAAVLKETMRLHATAPLLVPRFPSETCKVGGYTIPKGTTVFVNVWAIHRDPSIWEEPLEFKPERFLENKDRWDFQGKSFEFMPFGGGRRMCAGANLAERMMMYTLGSLVHTFRWELPEGTTEVDVDDKFSIALKKKVPLVLVPFRR